MLDATVVEAIAARDDLSEAQAHARALDTLRLVAASRAERAEAGDDPGPALSARRVEQLNRATRARLWLTERFEPAHGPEDIPADHRRLGQARADPRLVHPAISRVCQIVAEPPDVTDLRRKKAITDEPAWREAAMAVMTPLVRRIRRNLPIGDAEACQLIVRELELSGQPDDPRLRLSFPRPAGFDLDACREFDPDGSCRKPQFDPTWTAHVRALPAPGLSAPFFTQFGLHLVYVEAHQPPQLADDPTTESLLRQTVLPGWRAEALELALQAMSRKRAVRAVSPAQGEP